MKLAFTILTMFILMGWGNSPCQAESVKRWNILWISVEDISADLGCYGDKYAVTPNIDQLASEGVRYTNVFGHAGVCAVNRTGIITSMYPTTIGTQHMRCGGVPPSYVKCFTEYLRANGYFCTNQSKTDYNFAPPVTAWDIQGGVNAHWRSRPDKSQPFFCVINLTSTHESKIRMPEEQYQQRIKNFKPHEIHDPKAAQLPPYYPDTPEVRKDLARYADNITFMDKQVAGILSDLKADGLDKNTVVIFWSDHGRGLPRGKRWLYDSGLHVPLIVRWPGVLKPGSVNSDLVALLDLGPTALSIANIKAPSHMQGQAFLGKYKAKPREYIYGARDRMDETYDTIRVVRDKQYKYIRNYQPLRPRSQNIEYMDQMSTMKVMRKRHRDDELVGIAQKQYFEPVKPLEELYDTHRDPHEVNNLANDSAYSAVLARLRDAHENWVVQTKDMGLSPEATIWSTRRPGGKYDKTQAPVMSKVVDGGKMLIKMSSGTDGASIAYQIGQTNNKIWRLYTKPIEVSSRMVIKAKACRLGYKDSEQVVLELK